MTLDELRHKAVVPWWPDCARDVLGFGKNGAYKAAHAGELPFIRRVNSRFYVVVPALLEWLGADPPNGDSPLAGGLSESSSTGQAEGASSGG